MPHCLLQGTLYVACNICSRRAKAKSVVVRSRIANNDIHKHLVITRGFERRKGKMRGEQCDVLGTRPPCNRVSLSVPPALDRNIFQPKTCVRLVFLVNSLHLNPT